MALPPNPKRPYADLPPHPTIGELIAQIGDATRENLAKVEPPQSRPTSAPETAE